MLEFLRQWLYTGIGACATGIIFFFWNRFKRGHALIVEDEKRIFLGETNRKIEKINDTLESITTTIEALREGVLSSHFNALREKSIKYIKQGYVYPDELQVYQEELDTYKKLGGNGHMTPWATKVLQLDNKSEH